MCYDEPFTLSWAVLAMPAAATPACPHSSAAAKSSGASCAATPVAELKQGPEVEFERGATYDDNYNDDGVPDEALLRYKFTALDTALSEVPAPLFGGRALLMMVAHSEVCFFDSPVFGSLLLCALVAWATPQLEGLSGWVIGLLPGLLLLLLLLLLAAAAAAATTTAVFARTRCTRLRSRSKDTPRTQLHRSSACGTRCVWQPRS